MTIGVKKITDLPELSSADANDWVVVTDVSDTSDDGTGKDKKIKVGNLGVGGGGGGPDNAAIHTGDTASGDIGGTFPGPLTINAGAVTLADMANLPGNTMIGNNTAGLATPAAMSADDVLAFLGLGPISSPIPIADGGTGQTTANAGLNALLPSQTSNSGKVLQTNGTNASWAAAASGSFSGLSDVNAGSPANLDLAQYQTSDNKWHNVSGISAAKITSGTLALAQGGTGQATAQAALDALAGGVTNNQVLAGNGTHVTLRALAAADIPSLDTSKVTTGWTALPNSALTAGTVSGGTMTGGLLDPVSYLHLSATYTQTADPVNAPVGTRLLVDHNVTFNYASPKAATTSFGPRAIVHVEGTHTYDTDQAALFGLPAMAWNDSLTITNNPGTNRAMVYAWSNISSRIHKADAGIVTVSKPDAADGPVAYYDSSTYMTANTGTITGTGITIGSFISNPFMLGNVTFDRRVGFWVRDVNNYIIDLHSAVGSDAANETLNTNVGLLVEPLSFGTTHASVYLDGTKGATQTSATTFGLYSRLDTYMGGDVQIQGAVTIRPAAANYTASQVDYGNGGGVATFATTASMTHYFMEDKGTDTWSVAPGSIGQYIGAYIHPTIKNAASLTANFGSMGALIATPTITVDTATGRALTGNIWVQVAPTINNANSGTITSGANTSFTDGLTLNASGSTITTHTGISSTLTVTAGTVTTRYGHNIADAAGAGTLTNQVGLYIASLTKGGTTNYGIQNLSSTVLGSTGQLVIDASGNINAAAGLGIQATALGTKTSSFDIVDIANTTGVTLNASGLVFRGIQAAPTVTLQTAPGVTATNATLNLGSTWQGNTGATDTFSLTIIEALLVNETIKTQDTNARSLLQYSGVSSAASMSVAGSSSLTVGTLNQFVGASITVPANATVTSLVGLNLIGPATAASGTVTTYTGVNMQNPASQSGTLTTLVGVDIAQMTRGGTTNIGFRNAGSQVYTPVVCTCTSNAATVPVTINHAKVTNTSAATCTITLATANAVDGQETLVRFLDATAASQTVTFTNSETGKAGAPPASLGSTSIPSTYRFLFNSGTSKWTYTGN